MQSDPKPILTGLDRVQVEPDTLRDISGRIGYLCHSASVDRNLNHGADILFQLFGKQLTALFAPQHGLYTDAQDNMIESPHFEHPVYRIPVFSLYSETREPTSEMLSLIDTLIIDLQDSGVRVYTYIWTMVLTLKACAKASKKIVILDRPNPLNGETIEGNLLDIEFSSFIGLHPLPMRHGLTLGEVARFAVKYWNIPADVTIIDVKGFNRSDNGVISCGVVTPNKLPWVLPSPNLSTPETLKLYTGTVLFEGTQISEGRGTVRPFELFGHPKLKADAWKDHLQQTLSDAGYDSIRLRPHTFVPTFEKWSGVTCFGYQIHIIREFELPVTSSRLTNYINVGDTLIQNRGIWTAVQLILRELYHLMGADFEWRQPPFEYVQDRMPIDILNGTDQIRKWIEDRGSLNELDTIAFKNLPEYLNNRSTIIHKS